MPLTWAVSYYAHRMAMDKSQFYQQIRSESKTVLDLKRRIGPKLQSLLNPSMF